jgi:hypothetical protein
MFRTPSDISDKRARYVRIAALARRLGVDIDRARTTVIELSRQHGITVDEAIDALRRK